MLGRKFTMFFTKKPTTQQTKPKPKPKKPKSFICIIVLRLLSDWLIFLNYLEILGSNTK